MSGPEPDVRVVALPRGWHVYFEVREDVSKGFYRVTGASKIPVPCLIYRSDEYPSFGIDQGDGSFYPIDESYSGYLGYTAPGEWLKGMRIKRNARRS